MAAGHRPPTPLNRIEDELASLPGWLTGLPAAELGEVLPRVRSVIDRTEAAFADSSRRMSRRDG